METHKFEHMININSQSKVTDQAQMNVLRNDFKVLESMNLIDDEDMLYTLYMKTPEENCYVDYILNLLNSLYRQKYQELFSTYPSIDTYIKFCLSILFFRGEMSLRSICNTLCKPQPGVSLSFKVLSRNSRIEATKSNVTVEKAKPTSVHPLFKMRLSRDRLTMFSIGLMAKYCVPAEFALMFCIATGEIVDRTIQPNVTFDYTGIRVRFTRPVITALRQKRKQTYLFSSFEYLDSVERLVGAMSGCNKGIDAYNMGIQIAKKWEDIENSQSYEISDMTIFDTQLNIAIIDNFDCIGTFYKSLNIRICTDIVYTTSRYCIANLSNQRLEQIEESIKFHDAFKEKQMEVYYKSLEEAEARCSGEAGKDEA